MKKDEARAICIAAMNPDVPEERRAAGELCLDILEVLGVLALLGDTNPEATGRGVFPPDVGKPGSHVLRSPAGQWRADWMPLAAQWSLDGLLVSPEHVAAAGWVYVAEIGVLPPAPPAPPPRPPVMEPEKPEVAGFYIINQPDGWRTAAHWSPERRHWSFGHDQHVTSEEAAARGWHSPKLVPS